MRRAEQRRPLIEANSSLSRGECCEGKCGDGAATASSPERFGRAIGALPNHCPSGAPRGFNQPCPLLLGQKVSLRPKVR